MFFGKSSFCQDKIYKEQIFTKTLVNDNSIEDVNVLAFSLVADLAS